MELWFVYALLSALSAGLLTFLFKVAAVKNHNGSIVMMYAYGTLALFSSGVLLASGAFFSNAIFLVVLIGVAVGVSFALSNIAKVASLRYIDTAIMFPIYKTLGPIVVTIIGFFAFGERFSMYEMFGIAAGVIVPLMLLHKSEKSRQNNLSAGLLYMLLALAFSFVGVIFQKIVSDTQMNLWIFLAATGYSGSIASFGLYYWRQKQINFPLIFSRTMLSLGIVAGLLEVGATYGFMKALEGGQLAVAYTILSFYILIPIVLAVWFYKEHMNLRKGVAIALSILAIIFFKY